MSTTETTTGPKWRYHATKDTVFGSTIYEVRRADEREPFGTVVKTHDGRGWYDKPTWEATSYDQPDVRGRGDSREDAVRSLEHNLIPAEERARLHQEYLANYRAEQEANELRIAQEKLDRLRAPEHQAKTLTEAFHVLFDIKDAGDASRIADTKARAAFDALNTLSSLMRELGIEQPRRFDNDGRTTENGGLR